MNVRVITVGRDTKFRSNVVNVTTIYDCFNVSTYGNALLELEVEWTTSNIFKFSSYYVADSVERREKMKPSVLITSPGSPDPVSYTHLTLPTIYSV